MKIFLFLLINLSSLNDHSENDNNCRVVKCHQTNVFGKAIDIATRCEHWHSDLDIIAIKFKCCEKFFPCYSCHEECSDHEPEVWPKEEWDSKFILCGSYGEQLSTNEYMNCDNVCPKCSANFNPGCKNHYYLYFEESATK